MVLQMKKLPFGAERTRTGSSVNISTALHARVKEISDAPGNLLKYCEQAVLAQVTLDEATMRKRKSLAAVTPFGTPRNKPWTSIDIDTALHRRATITAAFRGTTIGEYVENSILNQVAADESRIRKPNRKSSKAT